MHPESFRFRPPVGDVPAELDWVLSRAFGPLPGRPIEIERPEAALDWARALGLRERIASRLATHDGWGELPEAISEEFEAARETLAARGLLLQKLLDRVAETASRLGARLIALKGIALLEAGISAWDARPLLDLDLLVSVDRATDLHEALVAAGLVPSGAPERHHLPPLVDPGLGELELHLHLPGVVVAGRRPATADDLRRAGLIRESERLTGLELPSPDLLAAHALAHALDQHGLSPGAYPITRLIADLIDLGDAASSPRAGEWIRGSVSRRERRAVESLHRALMAGEPATASADGRALLRHSVLALSSPRYRRRLRRRSALRALRRRQWSKFRSELYRRVQAYRRLE